MNRRTNRADKKGIVTNEIMKQMNIEGTTKIGKVGNCILFKSGNDYITIEAVVKVPWYNPIPVIESEMWQNEQRMKRLAKENEEMVETIAKLRNTL